MPLCFVASQHTTERHSQLSQPAVDEPEFTKAINDILGGLRFFDRLNHFVASAATELRSISANPTCQKWFVADEFDRDFQLGRRHQREIYDVLPRTIELFAHLDCCRLQ